jgi:Nucleotidyl transferase AbiEii toxin, Type IV TA system
MRCGVRSGRSPSPVFERPHHRLVAKVLAALNAPLLRDNACLFGGGTAIALLYREFRESVDMDFLVCDIAGYGRLRQLLTGLHGVAAILRDHAAVTHPHAVRADQYGIRTMLMVDGQAIKFEILLEARIQLTPPGAGDVVCGVATLAPIDRVASKLLANSDRWADDGAFSRDLIDLAMMAPKLTLLRSAVAKAEAAYGAAVLGDLSKSIAQLAARTGRLERCMAALDIRLPKAVVWQKIRALERHLRRCGST